MRYDQTTDRFIASLLESSPAPIVAVDRNKLVTAWNPAATQLFGWQAEEVFGRLYPLVPEEGEPQFRTAVERVLSGSMIPEYTARRRRKDGSLVDVTIALAPIRDPTGEVVGVLSIFNDITNQRNAESHAARLNDVLMAIRGVHRLMVHEKDSSRLVQRVCECLLEYRGYNTAWIARLHDGEALSLAAKVGIPRFESGLSEALQENAPPRCVEMALNNPGTNIVEDRKKTCRGCVLEKAYANSESIVVRLEHEGAVLGILGLSLGEGLRILDEERELIAGISDDLAFALHSIKVADERHEA